MSEIFNTFDEIILVFTENFFFLFFMFFFCLGEITESEPHQNNLFFSAISHNFAWLSMIFGYNIGYTRSLHLENGL